MEEHLRSKSGKADDHKRGQARKLETPILSLSGSNFDKIAAREAKHTAGWYQPPPLEWAVKGGSIEPGSEDKGGDLNRR
jgi:hypothetical protein